MTSAARMEQLRAAVGALALEGYSPGELLGRLATDTAQILEISLATLLVAAYDPVRRTLAVASAGHPPAVIVDETGARLVEVEPGPPLGAGPASFPEHGEVLAEGGLLVIYSDGLVECRGKTSTSASDVSERASLRRQARPAWPTSRTPYSSRVTAAAVATTTSPFSSCAAAPSLPA